MKASRAALFLLILMLTISSVSPSQTKMVESANLPHTCCMKYQEKVLPRKLVVGYRKALNCYLPAIIFVTKKNREVCTNPNNGWVQDYLQDPNLPLLPARPSPAAPRDNQASVGALAQERTV